MKTYTLPLAALFLGAALFLPTSASAATYTVQPGDWLSRVFPTSWREVCAINALPSCDRVEVGQVLQVSDGQTSAQAAAVNRRP